MSAEQLLAEIPPLARGAHKSLRQGACIMEAASFIAGEPWSDHPDCVCPVIATFLRSFNDVLPDDKRDTLLRSLIPEVLNTRGSAALERRRSLMAADWLVREYTPAWLRLAKLETQADVLAALPEITDMAQCPSLMPVLNAVRQDAAAAGAAARDAAWDAAWDAAGVAARAAAGAAAGVAAGAAAWDAAWDAAWAAARDAAWDAAWAAAGAAAWAAAGAAAWDAAWAAAWDALKPTVDALQLSAVALVRRMIAVAEVAA